MQCKELTAIPLLLILIVLAALSATSNVYSQTVSLGPPCIYINDTMSPALPPFYYQQRLYFTITINGTSDSLHRTWKIYYAEAETEAGLENAPWMDYTELELRRNIEVNEAGTFEIARNLGDSCYCRIKAVVLSKVDTSLHESKAVQYKFIRPVFFRNLTVTPDCRTKDHQIRPDQVIRTGQRIKITWEYVPVPVQPSPCFLYFASDIKEIRPAEMTNWQMIDEIDPLSAGYDSVFINCTNRDDLLGKFVGFKITCGQARDVYCKRPFFCSGNKTSPPVISKCTAKLVTPTTVRLNYAIYDPDNDLVKPVIEVSCSQGYCNSEVTEVNDRYAIIKTCLGRTCSIKLTAADMQCNTDSVTREVITGPRHASDDGYEWVSSRNRDSLLLKRFPDFKVFVDIVERPSNKNGLLPDEEIIGGVKLGLYAWASILSDMNIRFVDNSEKADFTVRFDQIIFMQATGISSLAWNGERPGSITIDIDDMAFRQLDFVTPRMKFERLKAMFDENKPVWSYYDDPEYENTCLTFSAAKERIRNAGKNPEMVCINWPCINWEEVPYANVLGKGREGDHDLAWVVQHEFGHTLGLQHVDMDNPEHTLSCGPLSCQPSQRVDDRHPVNAETEKNWIPRATLRKNKLAGITASTSPSSMIGNHWGTGVTDHRGGIFDIDADALSTGNVPWCTCDSMKKEDGAFLGFKVSYPKIRQGWLIVLQNRKTLQKFYTNNWHEAHRKMGWMINENSYPLDTDWCLVDILDKREVASGVINMVLDN